MEELLLRVAKASIREEFENRVLVDKDELISEYPELKEQRATFVTLTLNQNLRGCIGSIIAHRSLIDDLISNSKSSAFSDPRFYPLTEEEFENIKIEISLLTPLEQIEYSNIEDLKSKVRVGVDGIILNSSGFQATFLPQVWEDLKTFEEFFSHLCSKARLNSNCLESHPQIYRYEVKKIE